MLKASQAKGEGLDIAVIFGDGIGPAVVGGAMEVVKCAGKANGVDVQFQILPGGLSSRESEAQSTLPDETIAELTQRNAWILGPVSHHTYPPDDSSYLNPSGFLRKHFNLYANIRPVKAFVGVESLRANVDLVIVRENTEGFYADRNVLEGSSEIRLSTDTVISLRVVTRTASLRVAQRAFELAATRRGRVTIVHKANVLKHGDGLFLECCREVAEAFPEIEVNDYHVDAFAMKLLLQPEAFDVVVTTNMFGDILSDEAAGLVGGLGLAPSLNVGDDKAMAQAVHGSAPDIAELGTANPMAMIMSGALLLNWLGNRNENFALRSAATSIESAVTETLKAGEVLTPDLNGSATTQAVVSEIVSRLS